MDIWNVYEAIQYNHQIGLKCVDSCICISSHPYSTDNCHVAQSVMA